MSLFERIERHSSLMGRMADTVGADLADLATVSPRGDTAIRRAVVACMGCAEADTCETWLEEHSAGAAQTPDYCRNKAMLDRLARL